MASAGSGAGPGGAAADRAGSGAGAPSWRPEVVHTADLDAADRRGVRALCDAAFAADPDGGFDDDDWDHCLGGLHVLVRDGRDLVGHAAVVQRRLLLGGRTLRAGYVEAVAVAATHRRRGVGGALMAEVERVVRAAHDVGALGASTDGAALYGPRGWRVWRGPTSALTPSGPRRTPGSDGSVMVLAVPPPAGPDRGPTAGPDGGPTAGPDGAPDARPGARGADLDLDAPLVADWRDGALW